MSHNILVQTADPEAFSRIMWTIWVTNSVKLGAKPNWKMYLIRIGMVGEIPDVKK